MKTTDKKRRQFLQYSGLSMASLLISQPIFAAIGPIDSHISLRMPEEAEPHMCTWMAFVANDVIWSHRQIPQVKKDLALIAKTIAKYEPVRMLVSKRDYRQAVSLLGDIDSYRFPIQLIEFEADDLWLRDTGPTFVRGRDGHKYAIDFNFNGWGKKQAYQRDARVARFIANTSRAILQNTHLTLEGGCFEVDGHGTAIMTKSCILNDNRNPGLSQKEVETELKALLGLRKIIWLEGIKGKDITDGHTDFYARFIRKGEVIVSRENYPHIDDYAVTRENINILKHSRDADGKQLKLTILDNPDSFNERYGVESFAAGYIGYYVCNGAVIMQKFGDTFADEQAKKILQKAFPERVVEQIAIDGIASGGGTIHCATQQEIV